VILGAVGSRIMHAYRRGLDGGRCTDGTQPATGRAMLELW
jgi:hypothetical protein